LSARAVHVSKLLSLVLRHRPGDFGVTLDDGGWIAIDVLLAALGARGEAITPDELRAVVRDSDKQRFAISDDGRRVRAQQGHSVAVALDHAPAAPPPLLYHGTVARFLDSIRAHGLRKGERHHVHLSATIEGARVVGARRGAPVILRVRAADMAAAGHVFFLTPNGVWLTEHVPPVFLDVAD
jgi:putative RNA 2'-phosphotransferase